MVGFKDQALKKRDELIKEYLEENQGLKAQLKKQEQILHRLKKDQENIKLNHNNSSINNNNNLLASNNNINNNNNNLNSYEMKSHQRKLSDDAYKSQKNEELNEHGQPQIHGQENFVILLETFLNQSENYVHTLQYTQLSYQNDFFNSIKKLIKEYKQNCELTKQLQYMLQSQCEISKKLDLKQCMTTIEQECSKLLDCFQCKVMLFDEKNDEFNYLENNKIRTVKKDEGINSAVTLYQSVVRIDDAYQDPRFDRESDKLNNTRTNSLINAALIDRHSQKKEIIGIIQGINKHNTKGDSKECNDNRSFTKHDESIIYTLAQHCTSQLQNSIHYNQIEKNKNTLQKLVDYQYELYQMETLDRLLHKGEECFKELVCNENIRIFIRKGDDYVYFQEGKEKKSNGQIGVLGHCLSRESMVCVNKPCNDANYNQLVDILTELPLIAVPIKHSLAKDGSILGVIQFVDIRYLARNYLEQVTMFDDSMIQQFIKIFALCLTKL